MKLVVLSETVSPAHGMGNNWGETITKKYKCPCGAGTVTTEIGTTTGTNLFQQQSTASIVQETIILSIVKAAAGQSSQTTWYN